MALDLMRLGKLLSLAGSENEPEALAAIRKLKDHLSAEGLSFTDLGQKLIGQDPKSAFKAAQKPAAPDNSETGFTDAAGVRWPSHAAYEKVQAAAVARHAKEWAATEPERERVIARYGSRDAALARNAHEQRLHDAVADLLTPLEPDSDPPGRWHAKLGGWDRGSFSPPDAAIMARIEQAFPLPTTVRAARDEFEDWKHRSEELEMLMGRPGDCQLDLPAFCRAQRVQALYEHELPIRSVDDLHLRLQFTVNPEWVDDTGRALPDILEAFETLIVAPPQA